VVLLPIISALRWLRREHGAFEVIGLQIESLPQKKLKQTKDT
jgi:hypothetical protein